MSRLILILILSSLFIGDSLSQNQKSVSSNLVSNLVSNLYPDCNRPDHSRDKGARLNLPLRVGLTFIPESKGNLSFKQAEAEKCQRLVKVSKEFEQHSFIESINTIHQPYFRHGNGSEITSQITALQDNNIGVMALVSCGQVSFSKGYSGGGGGSAALLGLLVLVLLVSFTKVKK
jgi:rhombotail lipoprotein